MNDLTKDLLKAVKARTAELYQPINDETDKAFEETDKAYNTAADLWYTAGCPDLEVPLEVRLRHRLPGQEEALMEWNEIDLKEAE